MMRWVLILPLAALASPALAQGSARFPMDQSYKAISISGFDVQNKGLSLLVSKGAANDELKGSGNAGCNSWIVSRTRVSVLSILFRNRKRGMF